MNVVQALESPKLFAPFFASDSWAPWKSALAALFGLKLTDEQALLYRQCTGRSQLPEKAFREACFVIGRRGGKSRILALVATYVAAFLNHEPFLAVGETAVAVIICPSRAQARVVLGYVMGLLRNVPALAALIERDERERDAAHAMYDPGWHGELQGDARIFLRACVRRRISILAARRFCVARHCDIAGALRPGMLSLPYSMLILARRPTPSAASLSHVQSSTARRTARYGVASQHRADEFELSTAMRSRMSARLILKSAQAEYYVVFGGPETFVPREIVEAAGGDWACSNIRRCRT